MWEKKHWKRKSKAKIKTDGIEKRRNKRTNKRRNNEENERRSKRKKVRNTM